MLGVDPLRGGIINHPLQREAHRALLERDGSLNRPNGGGRRVAMYDQVCCGGGDLITAHIADERIGPHYGFRYSAFRLRRVRVDRLGLRNKRDIAGSTTFNRRLMSSGHGCQRRRSARDDLVADADLLEHLQFLIGTAEQH